MDAKPEWDPDDMLDEEGLPTPAQMEASAAITRQYLMKGLWHWLPMWETMGEPQTYSSHHVSPYPIGHHLYQRPEWARDW